MLYDIPSAIQTVGEALKSLFNYLQSKKTLEATSELIKDKRDLARSHYYAERAISIAEQRAIFTKSKYRRRFKSYVKKFREETR